MCSRRGSGPLIARTNDPSIDRRTPGRAHPRAPHRAHPRAHRSTRRHAMHLAPLHVNRFNQTPPPVPTHAAHRHPAARHARPNARPSPGAMQGRISATTRDKTGATARPRDRARAIARHLPKRSNVATRAIANQIANPIARRSLPRRASRSARPRGPWKGQPSDHRNGRRSARPNRNAAMWRGLLVTMTTTNAAPSPIKPKPPPAACACRSA